MQSLKEVHNESYKEAHKEVHKEARTVLAKNLPATGFTPKISQKLKLYSQLSKAFPPFPRDTG